ncbi:MAG: hypothetical protein WCA10_17935 [Terracidiphilus sp.]
MCSSNNRQYGTKYLAAMPTTSYGPGDMRFSVRMRLHWSTLVLVKT